ncbi:MAG: T9SS type A sorting domain-containing protein, partial [Bacteroidetes bacterium]|nr:T9SS type A sorting domain-containing protein [Bacteroidota bacterium]
TTTGAVYRICHANVGIADNEQFENNLGQNYPNPSTGNTQVDFTIAQACNVSVELFDITGRKIKTILNNSAMQEGKHTVTINASSALSDGSYFYKMLATQNGKILYCETRKMLIVGGKN